MFYDEIMILEDDEIRLKIVKAFFNRKFEYNIYLKNTNAQIGRCTLSLNNGLESQYMGNIGYEIKKVYRGHNYAYKASLLLAQAASHFGIYDLNITAEPCNIPSIKTIEKLGAKFICVLSVPKDIKLYKTAKQVALYSWNVEKRGKIK